MKTSYGKLALAAFCLLALALLVLPMRAGNEDSLRLSPGGLKMSVGGSYTLSCELLSDDPGQRVRFTSSDDRVAAVNDEGTVHAFSSGEAVITAKAAGGARAQMKVTVDGVPMEGLSLNTAELHIKKGQYSGLTVSYNDDASDTRLRWSSADETIATVDAAGRILGVGGGETYVSVLAPNGVSASAKVFVDVDSTAANISPYELTLGRGADVQLKVSYLPADSTDSVRRWASSDSGIAYVDENGVLHAKEIGETYITVFTQDGTSTGIQVRVEEAPKDLQIEPARATLERGDSMDMQLKYLWDSDGADAKASHHATWSSSDPAVASVDKNGHVTALRSGTTKITAECDGFRAVCRLKVQVNIHEIRLDQEEVYLLREQAAQPIQLHWVIDPVDADDPEVRFTSDNPQVAYVSDSGLVTMTGGYGTAVITASAESGVEAKFTVNVVTYLPGQETQPPASAAPLPTQVPVSTPQPTAVPQSGGSYEWNDDDFGGGSAWTSEEGYGESEVWDADDGGREDDGGDFGGEAEDFEEDTYSEFLDDDRPIDPETLFDD